MGLNAHYLFKSLSNNFSNLVRSCQRYLKISGLSKVEYMYLYIMLLQKIYKGIYGLRCLNMPIMNLNFPLETF